MLIKSLPRDERPVEKALRKGTESLSNSELLALMMHTGTRDTSVIHLAEEVLARCRQGISDIASMELEDLTEIKGIGKSKALTILACVELSKRMAGDVPPERPVVGSSSDVASMFMEDLRHEKKEHFKSVMVNTRGEVISVDDVSVGELGSTVCHPREVFNKAVKKSAAGVIFVHNHPSGDPDPSTEDRVTTERLVKSGEILGIRVVDHIIIGDGRYTSFKDLDLIT